MSKASFDTHYLYADFLGFGKKARERKTAKTDLKKADAQIKLAQADAIRQNPNLAASVQTGGGFGQAVKGIGAAIFGAPPQQEPQQQTFFEPQPGAPVEPPKKNNTTTIIIIVVAVIVFFVVLMIWLKSRK
jgi:hypothetical protein